jgi:putative ABC transport system permease protein
VAQVGLQVPGSDGLTGAAVIGYQQASGGVPAPPDKGQAYADRVLSRDGVEVGQTVQVGPQRLPLQVIGFVDDASFQQQGGLWTSAATWREVATSVRPDSPLADGAFQALSVTVVPGYDPAGVAQNIDHATGGTTQTLTREQAILAIPGLKEQNSTFSSIIYVTLFVAGIVVALFFALLTLERSGMYAVFGHRHRRQIRVITQAVAIAVLSFLLQARPRCPPCCSSAG